MTISQLWGNEHTRANYYILLNFLTEPTSTGSKMRAMAIMIITNVCAGQSFGVYSPYPTVLKVTTTNQRHTCKFHFEAGLSRWWMPQTLLEITSHNSCSLTSNNFLLLRSFSLAFSRRTQRRVGNGINFFGWDALSCEWYINGTMYQLDLPSKNDADNCCNYSKNFLW